MTLRVFSFSYDGGLCHDDYQHKPIPAAEIVSANRLFLNKLKQKNNFYSKTIVFSGSSRQSKKSESLFPKRGSCFAAIKEVSDYLNAEFDPFLLADVYGNVESGVSYKQIMDMNPPYQEWKHDVSKISILYGQIHKAAFDAREEQIAKHKPAEMIEFNFVEDRKDVINIVHHFFATHPSLLPKNVTLKFFHYSGVNLSTGIGQSLTPVSFPTIQNGRRVLTNKIRGTGFIDKNYRQTVKKIGELVNAPVNNTFRVPQLDPMREPSVDEMMTTLNNNINNVYKLPLDPNLLESRAPWIMPKKLEKQLVLMQQKAFSHRRNNHPAAAAAANQLSEVLMADSKKYFEGKMSKADYIEQATTAINTARETLKVHRGWAEFLGNLACVIFGLVGIFVKGAINIANNRSFFFVCKTDSEKKLDTLEEIIASVTEAPAPTPAAPAA